MYKGDDQGALRLASERDCSGPGRQQVRPANFVRVVYQAFDAREADHEADQFIDELCEDD